MIMELKGDLLKSEVDAIGHCSNCFGVMGAGIAKQIKDNLSEAFDADSKTKVGDRSKLGSFSIGTITQPKVKTSIKYVYNLYGQYYYGTDSRKLNYESIYTALELMKTDCLSRPIRNIGFPKNMGCKLAGGQWNIVESMIRSVFSEEDVSVYIVEYTK
mgnify:CR=1 FL=1|jgi:O-acetyl-ADP-ribose deacetylase (regulator of RNase III)